ncbi:sporulation protein [Bacillus sp. FJAT-49705]|uniref:Sporulation protein n=1 Tax=Cytobacillus citreus TaxID=2833586 RepID=A0ABS5NR62_9BACI|nr:sporulation protein [Cytobacillus citreus]MBS4190305.1 sporulation protein [Cytobacillus citreus]
MVIIDRAEENEKVVNSITILTTKSIQSEAINKVPFSFLLPNSAQVSTGTLSYRFKTRLAFKKGVEGYDQDAIRILEN